MQKQVLTRQRVLELIDQLQVGQAIPSERRLSSELGISRLTVRAALDDLVRDGYLERRQGSGTFVSEPKIAQRLTLTSFSEDMRRRGMVPGSRTLELRETHAGAAVGRALNVSPDARVMLIRRLRLAGGELVEFVRSLYRGDRYRLVAELSQRRDRPAAPPQPALVGAE